MEDQLKAKSVVKIGARVLDTEQAKRLLPTYDKIAEQVQVFRAEAEKLKNETKMKEVSDNTISILGGRGSGKTSVMYTIADDHMKRSIHKNTDIVLPLIVPEDMSDWNDTLGWFLGYMGDEVKEIEKQLKNRSRDAGAYDEHFEKCIKRETSALRESYDRVMKYYVLRKERYHEVIQGKNIGKADYIKENEEYVHFDQKLSIEFKYFINKLVEQKKQVSESVLEPLILTFFDDVDISAERCPDALETIRKYFAHPNIVVFVSGDYKVFAEAMTIDFMRREKIKGELYDKSFTPIEKATLLDTSAIENIDTAFNRRKIRSQDYLKKVLPPSLRFTMKSLSDLDKAQFTYPIVVGEQQKRLIELQELLNLVLGHNKTTKLKVWHYKFFDENPRGLINPFYYLFHKTQLQNGTLDDQDLSRFFDVLVNSSPVLQEYHHHIEVIINMSELDKVATIDYQYLLDMCVRYRQYVIEVDEEHIKRNIPEEVFYQDVITLYTFLDFFEIILNQSGFRTDCIRKIETLVRILNLPFNLDEEVYPYMEDTYQLMDLYHNISGKIPYANLKNLFSKGSILYFETKFYEILNSFGSHENRPNGLIHFFEGIFDQDEEWVQRHIEYIFKKGKDVSEIFEYNLRKFMKDTREIIDGGIKIDDTIDNYSDLNAEKLDGEIRKRIRDIQDFTSELSYSEDSTRIETEMRNLDRQITKYEIYTYICNDWKKYKQLIMDSDQSVQFFLQYQNIQKDLLMLEEQIKTHQEVLTQNNLGLDWQPSNEAKVYTRNDKNSIAKFDPKPILDKFRELDLNQFDTKKSYLINNGLNPDDKVILSELFPVIKETELLDAIKSVLEQEKLKIQNKYMFDKNDLSRQIDELSNSIKETILENQQDSTRALFRQLTKDMDHTQFLTYLEEQYGYLSSISDPKIHYGSQYQRLWKELFASQVKFVCLSTEDQQKSFKQIIRFYDDLLEEGLSIQLEDSEGLYEMSEEAMGILAQILKIQYSQHIKDQVVEMMMNKRNEKGELLELIGHLQWVNDKEKGGASKRRQLKDIANYLNDLHDVISGTTDNYSDARLIDIIRKNSLINFATEFAAFSILMRTWVQNRIIEKNSELRTFRKIKEAFRAQYSNTKWIPNRFGRFIQEVLR